MFTQILCLSHLGTGTWLTHRGVRARTCSVKVYEWNWTFRICQCSLDGAKRSLASRHCARRQGSSLPPHTACDTPMLVWATGLCWCFDFPASPYTNFPQVWSLEVEEELLCSWSASLLGFQSSVAGEPLLKQKVSVGAEVEPLWLRTGTWTEHSWTCQDTPPGIQIEFLPTCFYSIARLAL